MAYTTTRFLNQVKLKGALPSGRYTDAEILEVASDTLLAEITPLMISYREEYYVRFSDEAVVESQQKYRIHDRSLALSLREVKIIRNNDIIDLPRIEIEDVQTTEEGEPTNFFVMGNYICLYPTPSSAYGTLRQYYHMRPGSLVTVSEAAQITDINTGSRTLTFTSVPTTWDTSSTFDIIDGNGGFEILGQSLAVDSVGSSAIVFTESLPDGISVGDWVALEGETPFPYLLREAHDLLVYLTVATLLESMGDMSGAEKAMARAAVVKNSLDRVLSLRTEGAPKALTTPLMGN